MANDPRGAGFTLLEILVALAILALAAAALLPAMGGSLTLARHAAGTREAMLFAESKLAELSAQRPAAGRMSGTAPGGLAWRADILQESATPTLARYSLSLSVQPASGPPVRLDSVLLGAMP